jgi:hypothetical protein
MPRRYVFADEAGCFTFNREPNVSRYFILCTVVMENCAAGTELASLRRDLAWEGFELGDYFHATRDKQAVRDRVYAMITRHPFTVQATIMEKSKARDKVKASKARFYQYGYYYHFKYGATAQLPADCEALVTTASLGTGKEKAAFQAAVGDASNKTTASLESRL